MTGNTSRRYYGSRDTHTGGFYGGYEAGVKTAPASAADPAPYAVAERGYAPQEAARAAPPMTDEEYEYYNRYQEEAPEAAYEPAYAPAPSALQAPFGTSAGPEADYGSTYAPSAPAALQAPFGTSADDAPTGGRGNVAAGRRSNVRSNGGAPWATSADDAAPAAQVRGRRAANAPQQQESMFRGAAAAEAPSSPSSSGVARSRYLANQQSNIFG